MMTIMLMITVKVMMASHFVDGLSGPDFNPQEIGSRMILDGAAIDNDENTDFYIQHIQNPD